MTKDDKNTVSVMIIWLFIMIVLISSFAILRPEMLGVIIGGWLFIGGLMGMHWMDKNCASGGGD